MKAVRSIRRSVAPLALVTIGLAAWLALSVSVGAQTAAHAKPAPAKAAKPAAKKPAGPASKLVVEPRAMDLLKAMSA